MQTTTRQRETAEQRRIDRDLQACIEQLDPEGRARMLVIAKEFAEPGTMHGLLFGVGRIDL